MRQHSKQSSARLGIRFVGYLSAEGGRSLLAAALPCSVWAIDVVEPSNPALDAKVLVIMHAQLLCGQLLQPIGILGLHIATH